MIKIYLLFLLSFFCIAAIKESDPVTVAYFSMRKKEDFEKIVKPFFADQTKNCQKCAIVDYTPYKENGDPDTEAFKEKIESLPVDAKILFLDWNERYSPSNEFFIEVVSKKIQEGRLVITVTGVAEPKQQVLALKQTLFGKVNDIIILGELEQRDILRPQSYYGPEIFTAVRPPKDLMGKGMAPLIFVSRLAVAWPRRSSSEWLRHFKEKKEKSRNLWPELDELLSPKK